MKRILLPTDFSANARDAIYYAINLFNTGAEHFDILHAFYIPYLDPGSPAGNDVVAEQTEKSFQDLLAQIKRDFSNRELFVDTLFKLGYLPEIINALHKSGSVDIVVIGTKGATGMDEVLVGSNTSAVVANADMPVLVVPLGCMFNPPKNIVLAIENVHGLTREALRPLVDICEKYDPEISVLHVNKEGGQPVIDTSGLSLNIKDNIGIQSESVVYGIESYLTENKTDMLALVAHKHNLFEKIFHESITESMTLHTKVPLLVLRSED